MNYKPVNSSNPNNIPTEFPDGTVMIEAIGLELTPKGYVRNGFAPSVERRAMARVARRILRFCQTMTVAAAHLGVTRAYVYRLIAELEAWEETATPEEQYAEIEAQEPEHRTKRFALLGGMVLLAYTKGELGDAWPGTKVKTKPDPLLV